MNTQIMAGLLVGLMAPLITSLFIGFLVATFTGKRQQVVGILVFVLLEVLTGLGLADTYNYMQSKNTLMNAQLVVLETYLKEPEDVVKKLPGKNYDKNKKEYTVQITDGNAPKDLEQGYYKNVKIEVQSKLLSPINQILLKRTKLIVTHETDNVFIKTQEKIQ